ncbi:MAG: GHMP kinase [Marinilabiliaceae bacterium]|nr:GHMP kinase [Marinilabiliaceae bacterium]
MKINIFVPGRLCLFGEHSDWAGKYRTMNAEILPGAAVVTGIEQGIEADIEPSDKFEVYNTAAEIADVWRDFSCRMDSQALKEEAKSGSFFCYCAGVASYMLEWYRVGGVKITIREMTLPMKSGLSSSAAICVLVARAFNKIYNLNLNTMGEMNIAYWGELRTSSRCGRLDQACAFGVRPVLMSFDAEEVDVQTFNIKKELYWVFSDLGGVKNTIKILASLNKAYPFPTNDLERMEHKALGEINQDIVRRAVKYIKEGEDKALGLLMTEAQAVFDKYIAPMCEDELRAPKLHALLNDEEVKSLTYGAKGVGSQGDGSIQFLAKDEDCQRRLIDYLSAKGLSAYSLTIKPRHSVRKAIVPVAGFGTRLYPATRILKKDFFPIVDRDGMVKPVILILLEELVDSGIEEICLVLGSEEERRQYEDFFEKRLSDEHLLKLNSKAQAYEKRIMDIAKKLRYVYQSEKKGFGHAVYLCRDFAANEPVLLLLGDTIYRSESNKPCVLQFIEAYEKYSRPMIAVHEIPLNDVSYYGIISGRWIDKGKRVMQMTNITEKPTSAYAEDKLGVEGLHNEKHYYAVFGQYILTNEIFEQLRVNMENMEQGKRGEVELTTALEQVRSAHGMLGVQLEGKMYDMGIPQAFRNTIMHYSE